jgi:hypothetical protein
VRMTVLTQVLPDLPDLAKNLVLSPTEHRSILARRLLQQCIELH